MSDGTRAKGRRDVELATERRIGDTMDGNTWTSNRKIIDAIDKSQENGDCAMVTLLADDGEQFHELLAELAGICSVQTLVAQHVAEFRGNDPDSSPWAIQLCLRPLRTYNMHRLNAAGMQKALELLAEYKRQTKHYASFAKLNEETEAFTKEWE